MTRSADRFPAAVFRRLAACVCLVLLSAGNARVCTASEQAPAEMLRYKLTCLIEEDRASIECTADVWIRILRDSLGSVSFRLPVLSKILSVTDASDQKVDRRIVRETDGSAETALLVCTLPEGVSINDSLLFRIRFNAAEDTASSADLFINESEFLLQSRAPSTWVPLLVHPVRYDRRPASSSPVVIEMHVASSFTMLSGGKIDLLETHDGITTWRITRSDAAGWEESFCIAGSKIVRAASLPSAAGLCGISLYTPASAAFDSVFARSLLQMLGRASAYYAAQHYRPRFDHITFASIGAASVNSEPVVSGSFIVVRTGPEHAVFDSSRFVSSAHNVWLLETARAYAFDVPDSSYWFNESWAGYCATRFLFASSDSTQTLLKHERAHLLAHALDFFPALPIASGRSDGVNEEAVFTYKGRYVFFMLDYVLGRETFDGVIAALYRESRMQPPSIMQLQTLCEAAYGSSLSWFFDEWLYRTGFPDYVLTTQIQPTPRGTYEASVTVTQRGDLFTMPLMIHIETASTSFLKRIFVSQEQQRFIFIFPSPPLKIEWNPHDLVLRWMSDFRILAHARTSTSYRVFTHDLASSEKEARLTLQLDPENTIGANALALFSLGKAAGARKEWEKAEAYFLDAASQHASGEYAFIPLLSLIRHANILDIGGRRDEALAEYKKALDEAALQPLLYSKVIIEARKFLAQPFISTEDAWLSAY